MKFLKSVWEMFLFLLGFDGQARRQAVDDGICDFSGQGKDRYGR